MSETPSPLPLLDSPHAPVRAEGWARLWTEPAVRNDVRVWQDLIRSPYHDVQQAIRAYLENYQRGQPLLLMDCLPLNPEALRVLWARVLLTVSGGGRAGTLLLGLVVRRLEWRPEEAPEMLPVLAAALRSARGPAWRTGLAGLVQFVERNPGWEPLVRETFPELKW